MFKGAWVIAMVRVHQKRSLPFGYAHEENCRLLHEWFVKLLSSWIEIVGTDCKADCERFCSIEIVLDCRTGTLINLSGCLYFISHHISYFLSKNGVLNPQLPTLTYRHPSYHCVIHYFPFWLVHITSDHLTLTIGISPLEVLLPLVPLLCNKSTYSAKFC